MKKKTAVQKTWTDRTPLAKMVWAESDARKLPMHVVATDMVKWLEEIDPPPAGHSSIIRSLDRLEDKEYTVAIPITMRTEWWFFLRMAAAANGWTMGDAIKHLIVTGDEVHELKTTGEDWQKKQKAKEEEA